MVEIHPLYGINFIDLQQDGHQNARGFLGTLYIEHLQHHKDEHQWYL